MQIKQLDTFLPHRFVAWVTRFESDWLFNHLPWINPRAYPSRSACVVALLAGLGLILVQLREGLPPTLTTGLLVSGIFLGGEVIAALLGFALLGGYLGLRPALLGQGI